MKKRIRQLTAAFAAMTMIIGTMPSMAMADENYNSLADTGAMQKNAETTDGDFYLTKSLLLENSANIPASSFKFNIENKVGNVEDGKYVVKGTPKADGTGTLSVFSGINAGNIAITKGYDFDGDSGTAAEWNVATADVTDITNGKSVTIHYANQQVNRNETTGAVSQNSTDDNDVWIIAAQDSVQADSYLANKTVKLDFSGCNFTEPGVYRYTITEDEVVGSGITKDTNPRTLDVYVENGTTNRSLVVKGYVLYNGDIDTPPAANVSTATATANGLYYEDGTTISANGQEITKTGTPETGTKSSGFLNQYVTSNLTVGKRVEGNQGSKDKFFKFTIKLAGAANTDNYTLQIVKSSDTRGLSNKLEAMPSGVTDRTLVPNTATNGYTYATILGTDGEHLASNTLEKLVVDGTAETEYTVYLRNGEYVTLTGLPEGTKYSIEEDAEDYVNTMYGDYATDTTNTGVDKLKSAISNGFGASDTTVADKKITNATVTGDDQEYGYLNKKEGVLPTGIIMSVAPAVIVGIGVLAAIFALVLGGKKKELDEE